MPLGTNNYFCLSDTFIGKIGNGLGCIFRRARFFSSSNFERVARAGQPRRFEQYKRRNLLDWPLTKGFGRGLSTPGPDFVQTFVARKKVILDF